MKTTKLPRTAWSRIPHGPLGSPQMDAMKPGTLHSAALAKRALVASYEEATGTEAYPEIVTDLLADLRHLCDRLGWSYAELDASAHRHYLTEIGQRDRAFPNNQP